MSPKKKQRSIEPTIPTIAAPPAPSVKLENTAIGCLLKRMSAAGSDGASDAVHRSVSDVGSAGSGSCGSVAPKAPASKTSSLQRQGCQDFGSQAGSEKVAKTSSLADSSAAAENSSLAGPTLVAPPSTALSSIHSPVVPGTGSAPPAVLAPGIDAAAADTAGAVAKPPTTDQAAYKKYMQDFRQQMQKTSDEWKTEWDIVKKLPQDNPQRVDFVSRVVHIARTKGNFEDATFNVYRKVFTAKKQGAKDKWISWEELIRSQGVAKATIIAKAKTIPQRFDKKLPPDHGLDWPQYLEFELGRDQKERFSCTEDGAHHTQQTNAADFAIFDAVADEIARPSVPFVSSATLGPPLQPASPIAQPYSHPWGTDDTLAELQELRAAKKKEQDVKDEKTRLDAWYDKVKASLTVARKTHAEWDRKALQLQAVVNRAGEHENTKGTVMLEGLVAVIAQGVADDDVLMGYEKHLLAKSLEFKQEHLNHIENLSSQIYLHMKAATKKAQAINNCIEA